MHYNELESNQSLERHNSANERAWNHHFRSDFTRPLPQIRPLPTDAEMERLQNRVVQLQEACTDAILLLDDDAPATARERLLEAVKGKE